MAIARSDRLPSHHVLRAARVTPPPRVVALPSTDGEFARFVQTCLCPDLEVGALEVSLHRRYPQARVHPNDLSGRDAVWYAYRDGRWQPGLPAG